MRYSIQAQLWFKKNKDNFNTMWFSKEQVVLAFAKYLDDRRKTYYKDYNASRRALRHEKVLAGICKDCNKKALKGKHYCRKHLDYYRDWKKAWRLKDPYFVSEYKKQQYIKENL